MASIRNIARKMNRPAIEAAKRRSDAYRDALRWGYTELLGYTELPVFHIMTPRNNEPLLLSAPTKTDDGWALLHKGTDEIWRTFKTRQAARENKAFVAEYINLPL
jgi:hypothetical protein